MTRHPFAAPAAALALTLGLATHPALAQEGPLPPDPVTPEVEHQPVDIDGPVFVPQIDVGGAAAAAVSAGDKEAGRQAAQALSDAGAFCAAVPQAYAVDCLSERLDAAAKALPDIPAYADSKAALASASQQIAALARQNASGQAKQRFTAPSMARPVTSARPLTPVAPARQAAVARQAEAILEETRTVLIRSSREQRAVAPEIRLIAAAVDSNKVLLRSTAGPVGSP